MKITDKIDKYLTEGSMRLRLMNYDSDIRKAQQIIKDIQHDVITISVRGDAPNKLDAAGSKELNKLISDLDVIDIKMASVRATLIMLRDGVD